jgi:tetratricopeptide (TPR) repeat protein
MRNYGEREIAWIDEAIKRVEEFIRMIEASRAIEGAVEVEKIREAVVIDRVAKIRERARAPIISRLEKTDPIVASQEVLADFIHVIDKIHEIDEISSPGIRDLVWVATGSREVIDLLELRNSKKLKEMQKSLERSLSAQAKELKRRAEFAYLNGWIDEAESDLLKVAKENYEDFIVHLMLGNIYSYHRNDLNKAIEYYRKAAKYAAPRSKEYAADALLRIAECYRRLGLTTDAYESVSIAFKMLPEDPHVLYHYARYAALKGHEFMDFLEKCIAKDPVYLIVADIDEMFSGIREEIRKLAENLRDKRKADIDSMLQEIDSARQEAKAAGITDFSFLEKQLAEVNKLYSRGSYFDLLKLERDLPEIYCRSIAMWAEEKEASIAKLRSELAKLESDAHGCETDLRELKFTGALGEIMGALCAWFMIAVLCTLVGLFLAPARGILGFIELLYSCYTCYIILRIPINYFRNKRGLSSKLESLRSMIEKTKNEIVKEEARLKQINNLSARANCSAARQRMPRGMEGRRRENSTRKLSDEEHRKIVREAVEEALRKHSKRASTLFY